MIFETSSTAPAQLIDDSFANASIYIEESNNDSAFFGKTESNDGSIRNDKASTVECHQFSLSCMDAHRVKKFPGGHVSSSHTCPSVEEEPELDANDESSVSISSSNDDAEIASTASDSSSSCISFASDGLTEEIGQLLSSGKTDRTDPRNAERKSCTSVTATLEAARNEEESSPVEAVTKSLQSGQANYEIHKPTRCEQRPQPRRHSLEEIPRGTWHGGPIITNDRTRRKSFSRAESLRQLQVPSKAASNSATEVDVKKPKRRKSLSRSGSHRQLKDTTTMVSATGEVMVNKRRGSLSRAGSLRQFEGASTNATVAASGGEATKVATRRRRSLSRAQSLRDMQSQEKPKDIKQQKRSSSQGRKRRESNRKRLSIASSEVVAGGRDTHTNNTSPRGRVNSVSGQVGEKIEICITPRRPRSSGKLLSSRSYESDFEKTCDLNPSKPQSLGNFSLHSKQQKPQWSSPRMSLTNQRQGAERHFRSRRRKSLMQEQQDEKQLTGRASHRRAASNRHLLQRQTGTLDLFGNDCIGQQRINRGGSSEKPKSACSSFVSPPLKRPTMERASSARNLQRRHDGARKPKTSFGPPSHPSSIRRSSLEKRLSERALMPKQKSSRKLLQSPPASNEDMSDEFQEACRVIKLSF